MVNFSRKKTIIAQSLEDGIKDVEHYSILKKRDTTLSKVSHFINRYLDPPKDICGKDLYIDGVWLELQLTKKEYYWALSVSSENDFKLHLKRDANSCFINNYNLVLLKVWQSKIDLHHLSFHSMIAYLVLFCSYGICLKFLS